MSAVITRPVAPGQVVLLRWSDPDDTGHDHAFGSDDLIQPADAGLRYLVVTSVDRDDLPDGGAGQFAATVRAIRREVSGARVEVLTPDYLGDDLAMVLDAGPVA